MPSTQKIPLQSESDDAQTRIALLTLFYFFVIRTLPRPP
jgi:hypothetical protein